jgi:hypothetical protein
MFRMAAKRFDVVWADWRSKLLAVASDGARNMAGRLAGVISRLAKAVNPPKELICIWCGAHQLYFLMEHMMSKVVDTGVYVVLTGFI